MKSKSGRLKLKIEPCKICKKIPYLKMDSVFWYSCSCGQSVYSVHGDGILEATRKWNNAQIK